MIYKLYFQRIDYKIDTEVFTGMGTMRGCLDRLVNTDKFKSMCSALSSLGDSTFGKGGKKAMGNLCNRVIRLPKDDSAVLAAAGNKGETTDKIERASLITYCCDNGPVCNSGSAIGGSGSVGSDAVGGGGTWSARHFHSSSTLPIGSLALTVLCLYYALEVI